MYAYLLNASVFNATSTLEGATLNASLLMNNYTGLVNVIDAYLNASGKNNYGTSSTYNGTTNFFVSFKVAPISAAESESRTFNWTAVLYYNNITKYRNFTSSAITISKVIVTGCGDGNLTSIVYVAYDEDTWNWINASNYYIVIDTASNTYSFVNNNTENLSICIYPNWASIQINTTLLYTKVNVSESYPQRAWYDRNRFINNVTQVQRVYLINDSIAYKVDVETRDQYNQLANNIFVTV